MSLFSNQKLQPQKDLFTGELPSQFVVRRKQSMLVIGIVLVFLFGGVSVQQILTKGFDQNLLLTGGCCILAGVAVLLDYQNHRLEVDGENLRYVNLFGQAVAFTAAEIAIVRQDISENPKLLSEDGRLLARFDRSMSNFAVMIAYLQAHNITPDM